MEALAKGTATFTVNIDFEAEVEVEAMSTVLMVATYRGGTPAEVTYRIKGLAVNIAETTYNNGLRNATFVTRKAASLYNIF